MRMGSPEELAEQEKEPTDDGGEPLLPPSRLERAHDHATCVELYAPEPPLTPNGERVKRRAPGAVRVPSRSSARRRRCVAPPSRR